MEAWNNKGSKNWWVAPSQMQSENAMEEIAKMLPAGRFELQIGKNRILILTAEKRIWSVIEFKTGSDPSKLRGFGVHFFVMDEAAQGMPEGSYTSVETTTTNTKGRGIVISTPNGRGWFYELYERGEKFYNDGTPKFSAEEPDPFYDFISIRMPSHVNPYNDPAVIERKRQTMSRDNFRQEYLAQFMLESAGVFSNFGAFFNHDLQYLDNPVEGHLYVAGIDLADKDDHTVIFVMDRVERRIVAWDRFHKIGWTAQKTRIAEMIKKWGAIVVIDDSGIGDPVNEDLRAMGVPLFPYKISTNAAKCHLIDTLQLALENGSLKSPYNGILKGELEFYETKTTASGNKTYSAPRHKHDDCVIALALATLLCMQKPGIYRHRQVRGI
jgi:terminase large subunit-like protein